MLNDKVYAMASSLGEFGFSDSSRFVASEWVIFSLTGHHGMSGHQYMVSKTLNPHLKK